MPSLAHEVLVVMLRERPAWLSLLLQALLFDARGEMGDLVCSTTITLPQRRQLHLPT
jgi:hypothetical protein